MSEWIKCSDKLPEFNEPVLACNRDKAIIILKLFSIKGIKTSDGNSVETEWYEYQSYETHNQIVIAWMPLPEPPKEN